MSYGTIWLWLRVSVNLYRIYFCKYIELALANIPTKQKINLSSGNITILRGFCLVYSVLTNTPDLICIF